MTRFVIKIREVKELYSSLREIRYKNGDLSQKETASKIGISEGAYSQIENGKRTGATKTWRKIQEVFKLTDEEVWQLQKNNKKEQ